MSLERAPSSPPVLLTVVVASHNKGKLAEIRALLEGMPIEIVSVADIAPTMSPAVESGDTFAGNAELKARHVARALSLVTFADDSGLVVDALSGRPGVRSARFAGENATDAENNALLLSQLEDVEDPARTARFCCVVCLVDPFSDGPPVFVEGTCEGHIVRSPRGTRGFGYDPLFAVHETEKTLAELSEEEKNAVSHRGMAIRALRKALEGVLERRIAEARKLETP